MSARPDVLEIEPIGCPWCGCEPFGFILHKGGKLAAFCPECEIEGPLRNSQEEAIAAWNRRIQPKSAYEGEK